MSLVDESQSPLPKLSARPADSHKGDYGRVLVLGGSRGMAGAPALAGIAALRSGAGLVTVASPASIQPTVAAFSPCLMTVPLVEDEDGVMDLANVVDLAGAGESFDVWAIGPGLGRSEGVAELVARLYRDVPRPMVVDADGLNALAAALKRNPQALNKPAAPRVLTPHPGEMARLEVGATSQSVNADRLGTARRFARERGVFVVLKGARTVVARPDGLLMVCPTGNPGMATAGTGDVLTGMLVGLLAQGVPSWEAACAATYLHGAAGDLAAGRLGFAGMIAGDLIEQIPYAIQTVVG